MTEKKKTNNACGRKKHERKKIITENLVERRWVNFTFWRGGS